jgi:hypothetical protein
MSCVKRLVLFASLALLGTAGWATVAFEHGFSHGIGIDTQLSQEYGFFSGFGTFLLALIGYSGVIITLLHHINCHEPGCWRISRHKINGTPWCNDHHEKARPELTDNELLRRIVTELSQLNEALRKRP